VVQVHLFTKRAADETETVATVIGFGCFKRPHRRLLGGGKGAVRTGCLFHDALRLNFLLEQPRRLFCDA
jgi:hypothetical protein